MILLIILLMCSLANAGFSTQHTKCCPAGQLLDLHNKHCILDSNDHPGAYSVNVTSSVDGKLVFEEGELVFGEVPIEEVNQCNQSLRYHFQFLVIQHQTTYLLIDTHGKMISLSSCIDLALDTRTSDISMVAQGCLSCAEEEPCVNFCCPPGKLSRNGECVEDDNKIRILKGRKHKKVNLGLHCTNTVVYPRSLWDLNINGEMEVDGSIYSTSEYCIDVKREDAYEQSLLLCPMKETVNYKHSVKMVFMCLSMVSILVIILLHVLIEDLWTQHFTKLKIPFYSCLFLSFLVLVITSLIDFSGTSSCVFWALLLQYFSLSIFFWLTSMSLDIWLAFRVMANPVQDLEKKETQLKSRTKIFYAFSFGSPMVVTAVTGILQFARDPAVSSYIHPSIGVSCMLGQYLPRFIYFHFIILVLLVLNGVFYCLMVFKFTCGIWKEDSFCKTQMRNFRVFLELVFLMGINWISECVSFFVGWQDKENWDHVLLVFFTSINGLIGVFILLLFCYKSTNRGLVKNLFCQYGEDPEYYNLARTFSTQLSDKDETFRVVEAIN